jgi:CheY-like chemotaxis protein
MRHGSTEPDRLRVLLVEDDASFAEMYKLKLEQDEYLVDVASDGEEALTKAARLPPDLIFLDIRLPKLGGLEVLAKLRSERTTRDTPVVLLSNFDESEIGRRGKELGALEFVLKSETTPGQMSGRIPGWTDRRH